VNSLLFHWGFNTASRVSNCVCMLQCKNSTWGQHLTYTVGTPCSVVLDPSWSLSTTVKVSVDCSFSIPWLTQNPKWRLVMLGWLSSVLLRLSTVHVPVEMRCMHNTIIFISYLIVYYRVHGHWAYQTFKAFRSNFTLMDSVFFVIELPAMPYVCPGEYICGSPPTNKSATSRYNIVLLCSWKWWIMTALIGDTE
jgi:hypothetical protein